MSEYSGILKSPNYPGEYPVDRTCTWSLKYKKKRKILIIIPEISLNDRDSDKCGDVIIMRRSSESNSCRDGGFDSKVDQIGTKYTKIWSLKVPDLSHLVLI